MYTGYELLWLFFSASFLGWVLETASAALSRRKFTNRGIVNAPFCIIYGVALTVITVFCQELQGFWLFAECMILATVIEWVAGHMIERMYHERWWDYSNRKWNLDGYICLPASVLWGALGAVMMRWGNPLLEDIYHLLPYTVGRIVLWVLVGVLALDMAATLIILSGRSRRMEQWEAVDSWLSGISSNLERKIYGWIDRRIRRAYPEKEGKRAEILAEKAERDEMSSAVFAYGCGFYKIVWLFLIGAFLGDIVETIFCRITGGVWMSRSSVVWGPFSVVWGLGIAGATMLLYRYRDRSDRYIFMAGTFLGGAYEYLCSVFSEIVFGKVFWDYSDIPFNLGGRINLLYCFFWGIAAVVWLKLLYPVISGWIEKIPMKIGKILTWILIVFMCCNMIVSIMALVRSDQRAHGVKATYSWQQTMDERFDDARLQRIYPNALKVE